MINNTSINTRLFIDIDLFCSKSLDVHVEAVPGPGTEPDKGGCVYILVLLPQFT